jgi:hypothetical protein
MSATTEKRAAAPTTETAAQNHWKQGGTTDSNGCLQPEFSWSGKTPVSLFRRCTDPAPTGQITIAAFLAEVHDGAHREAVQAIREAIGQGNPAKAGELKKKLPALTLSGLIDGPRARAADENRFRHSGFLQADFDHLPDPAATRDTLASDEHVRAAFVSPSGTGCKALVAIPACSTVDEHKRAWRAAESHFRAAYGLDVDPATKDPARLCFASHDPNAKWNVGIVRPLPLAPVESVAHGRQMGPMGTKLPAASNLDTIVSNPGDVPLIEELPRMLAAIPPRPAYDEWLRISSAAWNAWGEDATPYLETWSPPECGGEYQSKFKGRLRDVGVGTLIHLAKAAGYQLPRRVGGVTNVTLEGKQGTRPPLHELRVNHSATVGLSWQEIEALRPPVVIEGFLRRGEVMLLGAESKSRKSWLAQDAGICVAMGEPWLADECGENGFPTTQAAVHVMDLELAPSEMLFRFAKARGNRMGEDAAAQSALSGRFHSYSLDGVSSASAMTYLGELAPTVNPGDLVVVDCFYRLQPDGNETADVAAALDVLKNFAKGTQAAVILVDHFRKAGADKARDRFAGSFVKQAGPSTLVAVENKPDDVLVLNIDARTFHGTNQVHARFDLGSYTFQRVPDADVAAARDAKAASEAESWLVAVWRSRPLEYAATNADARPKWNDITRQGADERFKKLQGRGFVLLAESQAGQAKRWALTEKGRAVVAGALNLHPTCTP